MSKIKEIFQSFIPLLAWRGRAGARKDGASAPSDRSQARSKGLERKRSLVLSGARGREKIEWIPVLDTKTVSQHFHHFRDCLFELKQKSKAGQGMASTYIWESGKLTGSRSYFFLQAFSERGFLVEEAPKGWVVAKAEKIASQSQFIRDRLAWDHVMLYQAENSPEMVKVSSAKMGESLVSLALYEDFMLKSIQSETVHAERYPS